MATSPHRHIAALLDRVGYDGPRLHPVADLLLACGCVLSAGKCIFRGVPVMQFLGIVLNTPVDM